MSFWTVAKALLSTFVVPAVVIGALMVGLLVLCFLWLGNSI